MDMGGMRRSAIEGGCEPGGAVWMWKDIFAWKEEEML